MYAPQPHSPAASATLLHAGPETIQPPPPEEVFHPYHATDVSRQDIIDPDEAMVLKNNKTAKFCRLVPLWLEPASCQQMICDLATPINANRFFYTPYGLTTEDGRYMRPVPPDGTLAACLNFTSPDHNGRLDLKKTDPVPPLQPNKPYRLTNGCQPGACISVSAATSPALLEQSCPDPAVPSEIFLAFHAYNTSRTDSIEASEPLVLANQLTGKFCRLALWPVNSSCEHMLCDNTGADTAAKFYFVGSGLRTWDGRYMGSKGPYATFTGCAADTSPTCNTNTIMDPVPPPPPPPLDPGMPITIGGPGDSGGCLSASNDTDPTKVVNPCPGPPSPENIFKPYHANDTNRADSIDRNEPFKITNNKTGGFCRLVPLTSDPANCDQTLCDLDSPDHAGVFYNTPYGITTEDGRYLEPVPPNGVLAACRNNTSPDPGGGMKPDPYTPLPPPPPLDPNKPITITSPDGSCLTEGSATDPARMTTTCPQPPPPQNIFIPFHANDTNRADPIGPDEPFELKNEKTGNFCRLVPLTTDLANCQQIMCDLATPEGAQEFYNIPYGLRTADGRYLEPVPPNNVLAACHGNTSPDPSGGVKPEPVGPQPPPVQPGAPFTIRGPGGSSGCLSEASATTAAYVQPTCPESPPPQNIFTPYHANDTNKTDPIDPNEPMKLKNQGTGKFCRLVPLTSDPLRCQQMLCDLDSPEGADTFYNTAYGLRTADGRYLEPVPPNNTLAACSNNTNPNPSGGMTLDPQPPSINPGDPFTITGPGGSKQCMQVDNSTDPASLEADCPQPPYPGQVFRPFHSPDTDRTDPIDPNEPLVLKNEGTGKFCRLVPLTADPSDCQQMLCDLDKPDNASQFLASPGGLKTTDGRYLKPTQLGGILATCNSSTRPDPSGGMDLTPSKPPGPPLDPNEPITINGPGSSNRCVAVAGPLDPVKLATDCPQPPPPEETFIPTRPDGSNKPIQPGEQTYLKSNLTGKYCRLVPLPDSPACQGMVCDLESPTQATPFTYTGAGLKSPGGMEMTPVPGSGSMGFCPPGIGGAGKEGNSYTFNKVPVPEGILANTLMGFNLGARCMVDDEGGLVYCPDNDTPASDPRTQFVAVPPPGTSLKPGDIMAPSDRMQLRSVKVGGGAMTGKVP